MFEMSEFDIIMNAIENKILELVPDAATSTLCSRRERGNGDKVTFSLSLGSMISLRMASWISAPNAAAAS
jgi:hypothetical protein